MVERSKKQKASPPLSLPSYDDGNKNGSTEKSTAFILLRSFFVPCHFTIPPLRRFQDQGRPLLRAECSFEGEPVLAEVYVQTRRSHQTFKDKGRDG